MIADLKTALWSHYVLCSRSLCRWSLGNQDITRAAPHSSHSRERAAAQRSMYKSSLISFTGERCQHNKDVKKPHFNGDLSSSKKKETKDRFLTCAPNMETKEKVINRVSY